MQTQQDPIELDDIIAFRDDQDPHLFYLIPDEVVVTRDQQGHPDLALTLFRGGDPPKMGGTLELHVALDISPDRRQHAVDGVRARLVWEKANGAQPFGLTIDDTEPVFATPTWTGGTASIQMSGDGSQAAGPAGGATPSLLGTPQITFTMSLDAEGATVLSALLRGAGPLLPITVSFALRCQEREPGQPAGERAHTVERQLSLAGLDAATRAACIRYVDLSETAFPVTSVTVIPVVQFAQRGITAIHVSLRHGDDSSLDGLLASQTDRVNWRFFGEPPYQYRTEVFLADGPTVVSDWRSTDDRALALGDEILTATKPGAA
jgi:hypothetical protein